MKNGLGQDKNSEELTQSLGNLSGTLGGLAILAHDDWWIITTCERHMQVPHALVLVGKSQQLLSFERSRARSERILHES